jgi:fused signal recognition particle receptor
MSDPIDLSADPRKPRERGFLAKLERGLNMTHTELLERLGAALEGRGVVDEQTLEDLEESLLAADLGVATTMELVEAVRGRIRSGEGADVVKLRSMLLDEVAVLLLDAPVPPPERRPRLTLVVGVNGTGKTTTIAKLAHRSLTQGETVLLAAADTFRAAAIEQLTTWGERLGVEVIGRGAGADPAAVVFDAIQAAKARRVDHLVVDTAGRLHTKTPLMEELGKIGRIAQREAPEWQRRTVLVLDATTGQNAVVQAREFSRTVPVDGIILTKLDGTAKGGVVAAVARELRLPVLYLGVGEGAGDLVEFAPREFAGALLGE